MKGLTSLIAFFQFQQATMGSLLKYYREKIYKQRSIIEQFKKERAELVALRRCGWRGHTPQTHSTDCSVSTSSYNRRTNICAANLNTLAIATLGIPAGPRNDRGSIIMGGLGPTTFPQVYQRFSGRRQSFSSPRRMSTPVRPDRLTFPPDHQEPDLSRSDDGCQNGTMPQNERPGSSRFKQSVHRDSYGANSPWFSGSTRTVRLKPRSQGNRR